MSSSKRMLKTLTYEEKGPVIWEVENGFKTKSLIAKEFGIPPNTMSTYLKNKETILNKLERCIQQQHSNKNKYLFK
ncbi:unnamed protein product [Macrosiphum euphorbiae]|uniref:HTH psq-type domain-containing protein n=1 Tax=Macrosiphum euphorbiae TaxID=13131 RepID=A0AAV0WWH6_9HEMI|nr:unnamed protein product [Macrosiphum euphorbiae]